MKCLAEILSSFNSPQIRCYIYIIIILYQCVEVSLNAPLATNELALADHYLCVSCVSCMQSADQVSECVDSFGRYSMALRAEHNLTEKTRLLFQ